MAELRHADKRPKDERDERLLTWARRTARVERTCSRRARRWSPRGLSASRFLTASLGLAERFAPGSFENDTCECEEPAWSWPSRRAELELGLRSRRRVRVAESRPRVTPRCHSRVEPAALPGRASCGWRLRPRTRRRLEGNGGISGASSRAEIPEPTASAAEAKAAGASTP
jgi:hypothetical protein